MSLQSVRHLHTWRRQEEHKEKGDQAVGNNDAWRHFEHTIIVLYDKGVLDLDLLDTLARDYASTGIDNGGSRDLLTMDGKELREVCIEIVNPEWFITHPKSPYFRDPTVKEWTAEDEAYNDAADEEFVSRIQGDRWGW